MRHLLGGENLALITARTNKSPVADHFLCSRLVVETKCGESTTQSSTLPLNLIEDRGDTLPLDPRDSQNLRTRKPNLSADFLASLNARVNARHPEERGGEGAFGPNDVFAYIYGVVHSREYRRRYSPFMKLDYPRIPLPAHPRIFWSLVSLGRELISLHVMDTRGRDLASFPEAGDNVVDKVRYALPAGQTPGRVWINAEQYFECVPSAVWEFEIGGYQVAEKWLKDRRGRKLSYDDIRHYTGIVAALAETIRLMNEIDAAIAAHGAWPEAFTGSK